MSRQSLTHILYIAIPIRVCAAPQDREEEAGVGVCKEGWSAWINQNKPIAYKTPGDVERIPAFIEPVRAHFKQRTAGPEHASLACGQATRSCMILLSKSDDATTGFSGRYPVTLDLRSG